MIALEGKVMLVIPVNVRPYKKCAYGVGRALPKPEDYMERMHGGEATIRCH